MYLQKLLYKNVCNSLLHNSPKLDIAQRSISRRINLKTVVYSVKNYPAIKKNKLLINEQHG